MKTVLLTGGAGFIGHHVADHILRNTNWNIVFLDRLDFSGNLNRVYEIKNFDKHKSRCRWVYHDLRAEISHQLAKQIGDVDYVLHLAASTHVDRSIADPLLFVHDNVLGTAHILEFARFRNIEQFIHFSTDEVFGPAPEGMQFKEWDRYKSGNPYAASKAGAEELCVAYHNTYEVPVRVIHAMNVIGQRQHPEKFIPKTIVNVRDNRVVTIHADKTRTKSGSRFYIHARNVADAILFIMTHGQDGEKYNVIGEKETSNLEIAEFIAETLDKELMYEMVDFHSARPGHDLRYALDGSLLASMGWKPLIPFEQSLRDTVVWTFNNPRWLLG